MRTTSSLILGCALSFAPGAVQAQTSGVQETLFELASMQAEAEDHFGRNVDLEGDVLVVGAELVDGSFANTGEVYVFERTATVWNQTPAFTLNSASPILNENFGASVAISGQRIAIGAPGFALSPSAPLPRYPTVPRPALCTFTCSTREHGLLRTDRSSQSRRQIHWTNSVGVSISMATVWWSARVSMNRERRLKIAAGPSCSREPERTGFNKRS